MVHLAMLFGGKYVKPHGLLKGMKLPLVIFLIKGERCKYCDGSDGECIGDYTSIDVHICVYIFFSLPTYVENADG